MITVGPKQTDLGELLGLGLGQGIEQGATQGFKHAIDQSALNKKNLFASYQKLRGSASRDVNSFLKNYNSALADNEKSKNQILQNYLSIIDEAESSGNPIDHNLAIDMAISKFQQSNLQNDTNQQGPNFLESILNKSKEIASPKAPLSERIAQQNLEREEMYNRFKGEPAAKGMGFLQGLGELAEKLTGGTVQSNVDKKLNKLLGIPEPQIIPNETEEQKIRRELFKDIGTTVGETALLEGLPLGNVFNKIKNTKFGKFIANLLGPAEEAASAAKGALGNISSDVNRAKEALKFQQGKVLGNDIFQQAKPNLEKLPNFRPTGEKPPTTKLKPKTSVPTPKTKATVVRTERAAPEARLFKTEKEAKLRETQLKEHPKYAEEITKDTEERAARLANQKNKGPVAQATQAQKMAFYESEVPKVRNLYEKASGRVRALENMIVEPGADKAGLRPLLDAAKKELQESEFALRQTINNAKTGEGRVGFDKMKKAAQDKILDIQNKVAEGEALQFSKRDYNPEFVKQAKELGKRKPLQAKKQVDYFTQVHDGYADVYKNRIAQIDKELANKSNSGLSALHRKQQLQQEKNALEKLMEHVDAENKIHRHKMALREMAERKKAADRLKSFKNKPSPSSASQKAEKIAPESIKKQKHFNPREAGQKASDPKATKEKVTETIKEATEEAAKKNPSQADKIRAERERIKKIAENAKAEVKQTSGSLGEALAQLKNTGTQQAAQKTTSIFQKQLKELMDSFKGAGPVFWKTKLGQDFILGFGTNFAANIFEEATGERLPSQFITPIVAFAAGRSIGRGGVRAASGYFSNYLWKKYRVNKVASSLEKGESQKYSEYKQKYSPAVIKKAKEKVNQ